MFPVYRIIIGWPDGTTIVSMQARVEDLAYIIEFFQRYAHEAGTTSVYRCHADDPMGIGDELTDADVETLFS